MRQMAMLSMNHRKSMRAVAEAILLVENASDKPESIPH